MAGCERRGMGGERGIRGAEGIVKCGDGAESNIRIPEGMDRRGRNNMDRNQSTETGGGNNADRKL